jgi:hypothetical protein
VNTVAQFVLMQNLQVLPGGKEDYPRMILSGVTVLAVIVLAATRLVAIDVGALCACIVLIGARAIASVFVLLCCVLLHVVP